ncbi:recombination-associated protein RdgC, partial [Francisella tularensis subsp. holarctica]|nr:recombination-associated protein RdgC [Francisella tularensis subsp. holarctica]
EDNSGHEVDILLIDDIFAELINTMKNWIVEEN